MIEPPQGPAARVVTLLTSVAENAFVRIFLRVAVCAGARRRVEPQRPMALLAAGNRVKTNQRKPGELMVEA